MKIPLSAGFLFDSFLRLIFFPVLTAFLEALLCMVTIQEELSAGFIFEINTLLF